MKKLFKNRKGFVLIGVVALSLTFIVVIVPLIAWTANEFSLTSRSFASLRALNLADAGAELAIWEIMYNNEQFTGWSGAKLKTKVLSSFTDNDGSVIGDINISALNTSPGNYLITSVGFVAFSNSTVKKTVKVKVFPNALFNNAIFGYTSVSLSGNAYIDSYNSGLGSYNPLTAGTNGDIGSNGSISRIENAVVKGDWFIGPGGSVSGNVPPYVSGETDYFQNEVELEPYDLPNYFVVLPSGGNLNIAGQNELTITSGDYRYESIQVAAKAKLYISTNTRIYVHNDFYIGGQATVYTDAGVELYIGGIGSFAGQGIVNTTGAPGNLEIYGLNPTSDISYTGLSDFYGAIYAPESSVYLAGNANYFGAIVGGNVTLAGNIQFHYDEALAQNGPYSGFDIAYWQED